MTDKEFKRLSRSQLIEIIYQLQVKQEELTADNVKLAKAWADKYITRIILLKRCRKNCALFCFFMRICNTFVTHTQL